MTLQELKNKEKLDKLKVKEDNELTEKEKETYIHPDGEKLRITSNEKIYMEYILSCESPDITSYYLDKENNIIHLESILDLSHIRLKKAKTESMNFPSRIIA